ncbi:MAG: SIR2 family protein, partial [Tistlia sp.]
MNSEASVQERVISLGAGLATIPERLLLAHARGKILFICGAGVSNPAGLPDFRSLVIDVYQKLDAGVHTVLKTLPLGICNQWETNVSDLNDAQRAEVKRFILGDYDVVLGMLERRLDNQTRGDSRVRHAVIHRLRANTDRPAPIHSALMRLADRGGVTTIATTNFDLLLERAARRRPSPVQSYSLGAIPRPSMQSDFSGVFHIHGTLDPKP